MDINKLRAKANSLPLNPGVYIMKNVAGKIIYIGKAKKLKNRVTSYFRSDKNHSLKVRRLVSQIADFEYIICDSEFEALILECSMIKQHSPKYNILLKDDKGYHYIKITKEPWPKIYEVKQKLNDGAEYLGPYNSGWILKQTIDEAVKIYKLPTCQRRFPEDFKKGRPCLNHHIGICMAPCTGKVAYKDYLEAVDSAISFIKGGSSKTAEQMEKEMLQCAENLDFERAAKLRDRISALRRSTEKQKVITSSYKNQDVVASARLEDTTCFAIMSFRGGRLEDIKFHLIKESGDLLEDRSEFLERYYSDETNIPPRIVLDGEINNSDILEKWLSEISGHKVSLVLPQKGEQLELVKMCTFNAAEHLSKRHSAETAGTAALDELGRLLNLKTPPKYIEAYDISHTSGNENVAGMTVFFGGKPLKSAYKKFRIKGFSGQDDYRSMAEVLERRFSEYTTAKEKGETDGFGRLPDLILLDGGKGQLGAVKPVLEKFGLNIPMFGMAKDTHHKTKKIASLEGDILIKANKRAYTLIATIQEETHRFAITYHRKRATKKGLTAELLEIEGVGPSRAKLLLKAFKGVATLSGATAKEIHLATKIPLKICENIENFYK